MNRYWISFMPVYTNPDCKFTPRLNMSENHLTLTNTTSDNRPIITSQINKSGTNPNIKPLGCVYLRNSFTLGTITVIFKSNAQLRGFTKWSELFVNGEACATIENEANAVGETLTKCCEGEVRGQVVYHELTRRRVWLSVCLYSC